MPWLKSQLIANPNFPQWPLLLILCKSILYSKIHHHSSTVKEKISLHYWRGNSVNTCWIDPRVCAPKNHAVITLSHSMGRNSLKQMRLGHPKQYPAFPPQLYILSLYSSLPVMKHKTIVRMYTDKREILKLSRLLNTGYEWLDNQIPLMFHTNYRFISGCMVGIDKLSNGRIPTLGPWTISWGKWIRKD